MNNQRVAWGDDCPVCKAEKSMIADVSREKDAVIMRCLKCGAAFRKKS